MVRQIRRAWLEPGEVYQVLDGMKIGAAVILIGTTSNRARRVTVARNSMNLLELAAWTVMWTFCGKPYKSWWRALWMP